MGLVFVDSDHVIEERLGCPIRAFWEQQGEEAFRDVEQTVIQDLTGQNSGVVLAESALKLQKQVHKSLESMNIPA